MSKQHQCGEPSALLNLLLAQVHGECGAASWLKSGMPTVTHRYEGGFWSAHRYHRQQVHNYIVPTN